MGATSRTARSSARRRVLPPRAPRRATPPRRALDAVRAVGGSETAAGDDRNSPPRATAGRDTRTRVGGWFYPQAEVRTTVSLPQLGLCDDDGPDGVKNQGNQQGEWFWCDSRMEIS